MRAVIVLSMLVLAAGASQAQQSSVVRIAPPTLVVRQLNGVVSATDAIGGVVYGDLDTTSKFPRLTVSGLVPGDRTVCVSIRGANKLKEWTFNWQRTGNANRVTFELVRAGARPSGWLAKDAAISARVSATAACSDKSSLLPASWGNELHPSGHLLINAQGATQSWLADATQRSPCIELRRQGRNDDRNWVAYGLACPIPKISCGQAASLTLVRARGNSRAPGLPVSMRGSC